MNSGTIEELKSAIKKAKEHGIVCYIDAVLNHRLGADGTEKFLATEGQCLLYTLGIILYTVLIFGGYSGRGGPQ